MKPYIDTGRRDYPHIGISVPTFCNPGRTAYHCSVQLLGSAVLIGQGTVGEGLRLLGY